LGNNPIVSPPLEIVTKGKMAIANYFAQLDTQAKDYLFEAKMLIVGEAGAGKTSLAWKIENEDCELPSSEDTTRGIEVQPYFFPLSKNDVSTHIGEMKNKSKIFRLNLWDFGGQEIYKSTHRFFLSKRSIYVLVADSRNEDTDFNYWLHIIEIFGGDSPLLIVLNEKFQRKRNIDIQAMKARFGNIVDVLTVDLAEDDKTRLKQLTQAIRYHVLRLSHIGSPVPARWTNVREALEFDERNTITLQDYLGICKKNSIIQLDDALVLSQYFHDIGVFLHFQDNPLLKNTIFLNSTWATQAVYQILDDPLLIEQEGRFNRGDAVKIWSADEFALLRDELLELMRKFFLAYKIEGTDEYILPAKLPASAPEYDWDKSSNLILQYKYDFFMPKGLLSQFIVQMNRYIADHALVWQRGVILERKGAKAEVIESYDARNIKIRVFGGNRRDFMTIISEKIDVINSQFEKMKVEKLIPCNCTECKNDETPFFYEYADLKRRIEKGRREVECGRSYEMVNVRALIDDVINESMRDGKNKTSLFTRSKVFISYSHIDKEWLERVQVHLKGLRYLEIDAQAWDDTLINAGDKWYEEIKRALAESQAAILLISADFLASEFIANDELPELLHASANEGLTILPVIIKPSLFSKTKLGEFQAINDPSKPLSSLHISEQEQIFVNLANRIIELLA
jgi:GTPase SAR1 family protein